MPITVFCVIVLLTSYINVLFSIALSIIIGLTLIWRAHPDSIIGLLILYLNKYNFYHIIDYKVMERLIAVEPELLLVAGFSVNLPTLASVFVALRVISEVIFSPATFKFNSIRLLLILWLATLIPATLLFFYSYSFQYDNWTRGYRFINTAGSFFYGIVIYKKLGEYSENSIQKHFILLSVIALVFLNINFFWSHLVFLIIGLSCALSYYMLRASGLRSKMVGLAMIGLSLNIIINSTITILIIGAVSFMLVFLSNSNMMDPKFKENVGIKYTGYLLLALSLSFPFIVVFIAKILGIETLGISSSIDDSVLERIIAKAFYDRFNFWVAAINQITSGPYFIVPSGRPLILEGLLGSSEWIYGSHNIVLEVYRNSGIFVGSTTMLIFIYALGVNVMILAKSQNNIRKSISSALIAVGVAGMAVADFPADITVGIFLWSLAGLFCAIEFSQKNVSMIR